MSFINDDAFLVMEVSIFLKVHHLLLATFPAARENCGMSAGQLWLFPPPAPLIERLGEEFFRALPSTPGVYLMCGAGEGVLYVGKARNLRKRLSSYRVANPERFPRRMIRLLHRVTRIEWDECSTEAAARHREEELICVLMPRFNAAGKAWPVSGTARAVWKQRIAKNNLQMAVLEESRPKA